MIRSFFESGRRTRLVEYLDVIEFEKWVQEGKASEVVDNDVLYNVEFFPTEADSGKEVRVFSARHEDSGYLSKEEFRKRCMTFSKDLVLLPLDLSYISLETLAKVVSFVVMDSALYRIVSYNSEHDQVNLVVVKNYGNRQVDDFSAMTRVGILKRCMLLDSEGKISHSPRLPGS